MSTTPRKLFATNIFEREILAVILISISLPAVMLAVFFYALFHDIIYGYLQSGLADHFIKQLSIAVVFMLAFYLLFVLILSYRFVHRLFGALPRVLKELDGIIVGASRRHIRLRPGDYGTEFLERINAIIDQLP